MLLALCEVLDVQAQPYEEHFHCDQETFQRGDLQIFANLKVYRSISGDALRVTHIKTPAKPNPRCMCLMWLQWADISEDVFTFNRIDMTLCTLFEQQPNYERCDSITVIYLPGAESLLDLWEAPEMHWWTMKELIKEAWSRGTVVTIVNAVSLDGCDEDLLDIEYCPNGRHQAKYEHPTSVLRRLALNAIRTFNSIDPVDSHFTPPGPVCPVQFVTLEEYRAHVGEFRFALNTDQGWIPTNLRPR